MTCPTATRFPPAWLDSAPSRLWAAILVAVAMSGPARAADELAGVWQGKYQSTTLGKEVVVRLTVPHTTTGTGELRFVTLTCAVSLTPQSSASSPGNASYVIEPGKESPGQYCGGLLGGRAETQAVPGRQLLLLTVTRRDSKIQAYLAPAAGS